MIPFYFWVTIATSQSTMGSPTTGLLLSWCALLWCMASALSCSLSGMYSMHVGGTIQICLFFAG